MSTEEYPATQATIGEAPHDSDAEHVAHVDVAGELAEFSAGLDDLLMRRKLRASRGRPATGAPSVRYSPEVSAVSRPDGHPDEAPASDIVRVDDPGSAPERKGSGRYAGSVRDMRTLAVDGLVLARQTVGSGVSTMATALAVKRQQRSTAHALRELDIEWNRGYPGGSRFFGRRDQGFEDRTGGISHRRVTHRPTETDLAGNTAPVPFDPDA